ncbi:hypothetical protein [Nostoc sp. ATCC 53789]|uniref:hypothetical protein n=1 Tax=Nostoc sp. ATCC 53789 TaxID=76335 RepID=UPI000DEC3DC8|nr:hypothetical protein [Nostoc sp. ATCC 53789]QHG16018.1 hypothetical protein GJB62_08535 [Nostoc sp. ATCC 53789]RCJ17169.1 hypothetical protein A6V25_07605 [Nostoc sp. ATCC 53789]
MDTPIIVALFGLAGSVIAVAGSIAVALLNHHLQTRVKGQEDKIAKLYALSMSEDAFYQLKKLATGAFGAFWIDPELRVGLSLELNYFKILGYIKFDQNPRVVDIRDLPKGDHPNDDLSNYISVTPQGRAFIVLREQAVRNPSF